MAMRQRWRFVSRTTESKACPWARAPTYPIYSCKSHSTMLRSSICARPEESIRRNATAASYSPVMPISLVLQASKNPYFGVAVRLTILASLYQYSSLAQSKTERLEVWLLIAIGKIRTPDKSSIQKSENRKSYHLRALDQPNHCTFVSVINF